MKYDIYILIFYIFLNCKGSDKKATNIVREENTVLQTKQNNDKLKLLTISQSPLFDLKKESRDQIFRRFENSEILIEKKENGIFSFDNACSFKYLKKITTPINYWQSESTLKLYNEELNKLGITLSKQIEVFLPSNPNQYCDFPTNEYIYVDGKIVFIYEGYIIVFGKSAESENYISNSLQKKSEKINAINLPVSMDKISILDYPTPEKYKDLLIDESTPTSLVEIEKNVLILFFEGDRERWYLVTLKNNRIFDTLLIGKSETIETENGTIDNYIDFKIDKSNIIYLEYSSGKSVNSKKINKTERYLINLKNSKIEKL